MNLYATLNQIKSPSYLNTVDNKWDADLLDCLEEGSRQIEKDTDRFFYLWSGTRYYDGGATRVIFDDDVYSVTTLKCDNDGDGVYESTYNLTTAPVDGFLYPLNITPKTRIEANPQGSYGHFGAGFRKAIEIVGVFGYGDDYPALPYADTGDTVISAPLSSTAALVTVGNGNLFSAGQTLLIESEQVYVHQSPTGNSVPITRTMNGTAAASHVATTAIYVYQYPKPIVHAVLIYAMRAWKRKETSFQNIVTMPELGTFTIWKGDDPDYLKAVRMYKKVRRGWYL